MIFSDESEDARAWKETLTEANLRKLPEAGETSWDGEDVVSALLSKALQHVFCHQFDEATKQLNLWPQPSRPKMKQGFAGAIKEDYPEFAAKLTAGD